MILLKAGDYLAGAADVSARVNILVYGMERDDVSGVEEYKVLYKGQLPQPAAALYTAPSGKTAHIKSILLVGTTALQAVILMVNGTTTQYQITATMAVQNNEQWIYEEGGWVVTNVIGALKVANV